MRDNSLLSRLDGGLVSVASFFTIPDVLVAEAMGESGVDVLIVDTEHSAMSAEQLQVVLTGLYPSAPTVVVRVADNQPVFIEQALDLGAEGVLIPGLRSRQECEDAVRSCFYPPKGSRGFGPRRASRLHGDRADYLRRVNDQIAVVAMVENADALEVVDEIVRVEGLSAIFVGTADLAVSMGYLHDMGNPAVAEAITRIAEACTRHRTPFGVFTGTQEAARTWIDRRAQIVTLGSDLQYLDAGIARTRQARAAVLDAADARTANHSSPSSHR
jgi:2-keto-3-deoxy-L-rhamnonate aldolase RhmA